MRDQRRPQHRSALTLVACLAAAGCGGEREDDWRWSDPILGVPKPLPLGDTTTASRSQLRAAQIAAVQRDAGQRFNFEVDAASGAASARNAAQGLQVELAMGAVRLQLGHTGIDNSLELQWTAIGRTDGLAPVAPPDDSTSVTANRASWHRTDGSEEWYLNGPLGLEQGFVLATPPPGHGDELVIEITVSGMVVPQLEEGGDSIALQEPSGAPLAHYGELYAHDALGAELPSHMEVKAAAIWLVIDDAAGHYPLTIDPLVWIEQQKLFASDAAGNEHFGEALSANEDSVLVGSPIDSDLGVHSGSAYVFARNGGTWIEQQKLLASDGMANDLFGQAVALSGNTALVGAHGHGENGPNSGAAYVFIRNGGAWTEQQKLLPNNGAEADWFGWSVAADGNTVLVGAAGDDDNGVGGGAVYVFIRNGGQWTEQQKLLPSDGVSHDWFGWSVALSGDTALVGSFADDDKGEDSGSAYVFVRNGSQWTEQQKLVASDGSEADWLARSVSLSGDTALVSALGAGQTGHLSGAAYVFVRNGTGWTEQQKLLASDSAENDLFAWSVSVSADRALVGAHEDDDNGVGSGSAYVFARTGNSWTEEQKLVASDGTENDSFGKAVSVSGRTVLVGAPDDYDNVVGGSAYLFVGKLTNGEPCTEDDECLSTFCVDGVCCDSDCGGGDETDCLACSIAAGGVEDGLCGPSSGNPCDDADLCTETDTCATGTCMGAPIQCPPLNQCQDEGSCDPETGLCFNAIVADGMPCDDGDPCTPSDTCESGTCTGAGEPCSAQDECHEPGSCQPQTGTCDHPTKPDGTPCSIGTCQGGLCLGDGGGGAGGAGDSHGSIIVEQRCGCRVPSGGQTSPWWLLGLLPLLARRHRRQA